MFLSCRPVLFSQSGQEVPAGPGLIVQVVVCLEICVVLVMFFTVQVVLVMFLCLQFVYVSYVYNLQCLLFSDLFLFQDFRFRLLCNFTVVSCTIYFSLNSRRALRVRRMGERIAVIVFGFIL